MAALDWFFSLWSRFLDTLAIHIVGEIAYQLGDIEEYERHVNGECDHEPKELLPLSSGPKA